MLPLLPLYPIGIGLLAGVAWLVKRNRKTPVEGKAVIAGEMTPERQIIYQTALTTLKDPVKLQELADGFRKGGLPLQAALLDKRAKLRLLPDSVKEARREAYRKGISCEDPVAVLALADAFEKEGATGAAASLKGYADKLKKAAS